MRGFVFTSFQEDSGKGPFEKLLEIFLELVTHTSGDVDEAIDWLRELDKEYSLTDETYSIDDFIEELNRKKFIRQSDKSGDGKSITPKINPIVFSNDSGQIFFPKFSRRYCS